MSRAPRSATKVASYAENSDDDFTSSKKRPKTESEAPKKQPAPGNILSTHLHVHCSHAASLSCPVRIPETKKPESSAKKAKTATKIAVLQQLINCDDCGKKSCQLKTIYAGHAT